MSADGERGLPISAIGTFLVLSGASILLLLVNVPLGLAGIAVAAVAAAFVARRGAPPATASASDSVDAEARLEGFIVDPLTAGEPDPYPRFADDHDTLGSHWPERHAEPERLAEPEVPSDVEPSEPSVPSEPPEPPEPYQPYEPLRYAEPSEPSEPPEPHEPYQPYERPEPSEPLRSDALEEPVGAYEPHQAPWEPDTFGDEPLAVLDDREGSTITSDGLLQLPDVYDAHDDIDLAQAAEPLDPLEEMREMRQTDEQWRERDRVMGHLRATYAEAAERLNVALARWQQVAGDDADPYDPDPVIRAHDPQLDYDLRQIEASPTVRTVAAYHRSTQARWRVLWASLGVDEVPEPDAVESALLAILDSWAEAESAADRLTAAEERQVARRTLARPLVLVEPSTWIDEPRLAQLLASIPAETEAVVVERAS